MEFVKLRDAIRKETSLSCVVMEYPMQNPEMSIGVTELSGRYPDQGWALNHKCVEMGYVIRGNGKLVTETESIDLSEGDVVLIPRGQKYYWEGTMSVVLPTTPPWSPEQHAHIQETITASGLTRKFRQDKLWRDKAVDRFAGSTIHWERLDDERFAAQLKSKLREEADEVCLAKTRESLKEELADILEVVTAFCELNGLTLEEIVEIQRKKHVERGGFQGRKYVTIAEHPTGSFGEQYCIRDPEKYPEVVE